MGVLVGVDWGGGAHAVCVIDAGGRQRDRFVAGHDRDGHRLQALRPQSDIIKARRGRAWTDRRPYDPAKHTSANPFRVQPNHAG